MLFTLYAVSTVGKIVALVSQIPRCNVILYGELLYTCNEIISELVFFVYLIDEIATRKKLWIDLNSRSDMYSRCLF